MWQSPLVPRWRVLVLVTLVRFTRLITAMPEIGTPKFREDCVLKPLQPTGQRLERMHKFVGVTRISHRGGSLEGPENTMFAFKNAVYGEGKTHMLELDVWRSADDKV
eukprot:GHVT01021155.1.p1 GENE.GHVT01021155.1~~GHVT01021155.1.p1  ORF type:complete len:107 (-),score=3.21 GHVT01021155.1:257-577(-)